MTPFERKALEAKRKDLEAQRDKALANAHQAAGGIAMIDLMLRFPEVAPPQPAETEQAVA